MIPLFYGRHSFCLILLMDEALATSISGRLKTLLGSL